LFGIVIAGEVHPQPQFLSFGYAFTTIFIVWLCFFNDESHQQIIASCDGKMDE
jgi:hypothetical protein